MTSAFGRGMRSSFVVRVVADRRGRLVGVIERVATGAKEVFKDLDAIGSVIKAMLLDERGVPRSPAEDATPRSHSRRRHNSSIPSRRQR